MDSSKQLTSKIKSFSEFLKTRSIAPKINLAKSSSLPNEILLRIFDFLDLTDLLNCAQVCSNWHYLISTNNFIWLKWSKMYKCHQELVQLMNEANLSPKQCFIRILFQKIQLDLFKQFEKISKRKSLYTGLVDFRSFTNDVKTLNWTMELLNKNGKLIQSIKADEQNNFDSSFSVLWFSFSDLNEKILADVTKLRIYAQIPISMDVKTGRVVFKSPNSNVLGLKLRPKLIRKIEDFNFLTFKNEISNKIPSCRAQEVYEDTLVKIFQVDPGFIFGFWNQKSNSLSKKGHQNFAFITYNSVFDDSLVQKLFEDVKSPNTKYTGPKKGVKPKPTIKMNLELDSRWGLHDYKVYLSLRNQTRSTFVCLCQTVYNAGFKKYNGVEYLHLNVLNCDLKENLGPELSMLPKFTWRADALDKNTIDQVAIMDFCLFDSNSDLMESNSSIVQFKPNDDRIPESFISDKCLNFVYSGESYRVMGTVNCFQENFSYSSKGQSFHLTKLEVYLALKFVNNHFGTNFSNEGENKKF